MKCCSYCGRENTDEALRCHECGTEFEQPRPVETPRVEPPRPEYYFPPLSDADRQKHVVTLVSCANLMAADLVAATLRSAGIEAFIPDESMIQAQGLATPFGYARVQVSPKDYEAARDLLGAAGHGLEILG